MADRPQVKERDWIKVGAIDAVVILVANDYIEVGYHQHTGKAIKEDAIWNGSTWEFRHSGPAGSYLRGPEEVMVKRGPPRIR